MATLNQNSIELGTAGSPRPGQAETGDHYVVKPFPNGLLVAAIDGLGHGEEAAFAARRAVAVLEADPGDPVISLVRRCHQALRTTRGVVMSIASFDLANGMLTWLGIGNVSGILLRSEGVVPEGLLLRPGVVGGQLPALQAAVLSVSPGDTLVFATDGIRREFADELIPGEPPQKAAERILEKFYDRSDDALVLVLRYLGNFP